MYDIVVIGSGPAGYTAALEAAKRQYKTALIEKNLNNLGGTCLNEGCIPLKGLLYYSGSVTDYLKIINIVSGKVNEIRKGLLSRLKNAGIEIMEGEAGFVSKDEITCSGKKITAKNFIIATGSKQKRIFNGKNVFGTKEIFGIKKIPSSVLIIGGGAAGCEYAAFFNKLGIDVTIVEMMPTLLPGEDGEVVRLLEKEFRKKRIKILTDSKIADIKENGKVLIQTHDGNVEADFEMIFEAAGRTASLDGLNPEIAGIEKTQKGFINVNCSMRTNVPNIYAAGDCIETPMLAYTAFAEAETAVKHIADENPEPIDYNFIPRIVFSSPQVGSVGFNEQKARMHKVEYNVYKYFFRANGKAAMEGRDTGFIKLIEDREEERIIGGFVTGDEIVDLINELSLIVNNRMKTQDVKKSIHVHPSYSEIIPETLRYGKQEPR